MPLTTAATNFIAAALIGDTSLGPLFNNANAYLGIGDNTTAFANTQTDLQATVNRLRKISDSGFPTRNGNVLTFQSTFGVNDANFAWNEWAIFNAQYLANPASAVTVTAASGGTFPAGTYTVAYALTDSIGTTLISPTSTITLTVNQAIQFPAITLPSGATGVTYYVSQAAGSSTLLADGTSNGAATLITGVPAANAAAVPSVNTASGTMLQRLVEYDGTKQSGQTWVMQVQITINIGN